MFCSKCGAKNNNGKIFCTKCGEKLLGNPKPPIRIPDKITIDTRFIKELSKFQKMYVGGGILILISSFLPWINFKSPSLGTSLSSLATSGVNGILRSNSINVWTFGIFSLQTILYFVPLIFLGYIFYQELILKKVVPTYFKSLVMVLLSLFTFSINLQIVMAVGQIQSILGAISGLIGAGSLISGMFGVGIGSIGGVVGCSFVMLGFLSEMKMKDR
jgi:DNA-directed RNA polymerase subunit RPC12/RpoP